MSDALYPFAISDREFPLGSDIGGVYRMDYAMSRVSGRRALAEAILRRLTTRKGGLFYAPTYGFSVADLIGASLPPGLIEQGVLEQVLSEEEVEDARCAVTVTGESIAVDIKVKDAEGPFTLTLSVDGDGPQLSIRALLDETLIVETA